MELTFTAISEDRPGATWGAMFQRMWPAYRRWYLREGIEERPTYLACRRAIRTHMPELAELYDELCECAGGGDLAARFLSLYRPPAYLSGCSQAVWPGQEPLLVRNYDYSPLAFDAVILRTRWLGRPIMGMSDCMIGLIDGMNDAGLAVSLTFGGRRAVGDGFGAPMILRYVLETCDTVDEAVRVLTRVPSHMAYNVTALDAKGAFVTVYLSADRSAIVTNAPVATNHQENVEWGQHARATATVERERFILHRLMKRDMPQDRFLDAFLRPPLYALGYSRGNGTLYTAAYWPQRRSASYVWPTGEWRFGLDDFTPGTRRIGYPLAA
ncbi:MAG TPA: C45 family peptidase [Alphaproteobacteria bacterium]|nr:C45 family peptidase [Alphaproteobacteria bacterium]